MPPHPALLAHEERAGTSIAFAAATMSLVTMTIAAEGASAPAQPAAPKRRRRLGRSMLGLVLPVALAVAWEFIVRIGLGQRPAGAAAVGDLQRIRRAGAHRRPAKQHAGDAGSRAAGFGFGVIVATVLGAAAGYSPLVRRLLDPSLQALRAIPSIAWVPLFVLWLGIFEASKITLIAVGVFFPVYLGVMGAIQSVDRKLVEVGRAFRLSDFAMVRRILLPAVLPAYVISLRSGLGLGWMFVAAAELLGHPRVSAICCWTASSSASRPRSSRLSWRLRSSARRPTG